MAYISYDTLFLQFASTSTVECDNTTGSVYSAYSSAENIRVVCVAPGVGLGTGLFPSVDSFSHYFDAIAFACGVLERFRSGRNTNLVESIECIEKLRPEILASHAIEELLEKYLGSEYIREKYIEYNDGKKRIWKRNRDSSGNNKVHIKFTMVPEKDDTNNKQNMYRLVAET